MTTNILDAIKQAYAAGLNDGARQAEVIARIHAEHNQATQTLNVGDHTTANGARKRPGRVAKAATAPKVPAKASGGLSKASGTRKAGGPREKGVKERIVGMIAITPMTAGAIIAQTGFKSTSVRATLMSLKKAGGAVQVDDKWFGEGHPGWRGSGELPTGNSESEAAAL